jgi:heat shock protein HtpX
MDDVDKVTSASFIDQPQGDMRVTKKGSGTHPPIWNRIRILKNMSQGVGFIDYQKAYNEVVQHKANFMPDSMLASKISFPMRGASALSDEPGFVETREEFNKLENNDRSEDITRLSEDFGFISCPCGMKIKTPPDYKKLYIKCPRCGRTHALADKMENVLGSMLEDPGISTSTGTILADILQEEPEDSKPDYSNEEVQTHTHHKNGWEEVVCKCGAKNQISPTFVGSFIRCRKCKRKIIINK